MDMLTMYYMHPWDLGRSNDYGGRLYFMRQIPKEDTTAQ
jgi:hypothetical protein